VCVCVCVCVRVCGNTDDTTLISQQYTTYKLNAAYTNNPSLSLSSLDTWIKATEEGLTRVEAV